MSIKLNGLLLVSSFSSGDLYSFQLYNLSFRISTGFTCHLPLHVRRTQPAKTSSLCQWAEDSSVPWLNSRRDSTHLSVPQGLKGPFVFFEDGF